MLRASRAVVDLRFLWTLPGVPRRWLSRCAGAAARLPIPRPTRGYLWPLAARALGIDSMTVPGHWSDYRSFLELFTRALPAGGRPRPQPEARSWLAPCDGLLVDHVTLSAEGTWLIKGAPYSTEDLLPGSDARRLAGYQALQIYLAPRDYHRFHAPCELHVLEAASRDGDLQPVDPRLARRSLRVLARNRRVLLHCEFPGDPAPQWLGLLFVGAMNVGRMRFTFDDTLAAPPFLSGRRRYDPPPRCAAGEELGRFEFGSTVVLFAPPLWKSRVEIGGRCRALEPLLDPIYPTPEAETEH